MSNYTFLRIWFHQIFGMHHFRLVKIAGRDGYKARCSCGCYLKRTAPGIL